MLIMRKKSKLLPLLNVPEDEEEPEVDAAGGGCGVLLRDLVRRAQNL